MKPILGLVIAAVIVVIGCIYGDDYDPFFHGLKDQEYESGIHCGWPERLDIPHAGWRDLDCSGDERGWVCSKERTAYLPTGPLWEYVELVWYHPDHGLTWTMGADWFVCVAHYEETEFQPGDA